MDGKNVLDKACEAMYRGDLLAARSLCLEVEQWIINGEGKHEGHKPEYVTAFAQVLLDASEVRGNRHRIDTLKRELSNARREAKEDNARIAELEAACVMGGDGKPIGIGQKVYFRGIDNKVISDVIGSLVTSRSGLMRATMKNKTSYAPRPSECFSSPDSVPQPMSKSMEKRIRSQKGYPDQVPEGGK